MVLADVHTFWGFVWLCLATAYSTITIIGLPYLLVENGARENKRWMIW